MYTSFDKIQDRFGFSTGGAFKCAYKNTRTLILAGLITIGVIFVLTGISVVYVVVRMKNIPGMASAQLTSLITGIISGQGLTGDAAAGGGLAGFGLAVVSISFGVFLLLIAVIAFLIIITTMRVGQTYKFKADETKFTVIYPEKVGQMLTIEYDYIIGIYSEEWRFLFAPKCLDITIQTKMGEFTFRCIHTPMSKANGIAETPFNIIRERIGLAHEDEAVLINKDASREQRPGFFR